MCWAVPSALLCCGLKYMEQYGFLSLEALSVLSEGNIYSGFTYVLGFSLVFRTSQAYSRYWTACTSVHEMASEWSDACASLIAFVSVSRFSPEETLKFRHTVVRLFSLLHGMALTEISQTDIQMPLLDVDGLNKAELQLLASPSAQGKTVQIVLCWIKAYVTRNATSGLLPVPPPLLTRVFQELGVGLRNFHAAHQVGVWPFPFPYTQMTVLLIQFYTVMTPLVISTWSTHPVIGITFCFISVTCMVGLDLIANELEDPFGDDPNDLPLVELQGDMNKFLIMQLHPIINQPPELLSTAIMDPKKIMAESNNGNRGLNLNALKRNFRKSKSIVLSERRDRLLRQRKWVGLERREQEASRIGTVLHLNNLVGYTSSMLMRPSDSSSWVGGNNADMNDLDFGSASTGGSSDWMAAHALSHATLPSLAEEELESKRQQQAAQSEAEEERAEPAAEPQPSQWGRFLDALQGELREHLESRKDMQKRELGAVEKMLQLLSGETAARGGAQPKRQASDPSALEAAVSSSKSEEILLRKLPQCLRQASEPRVLDQDRRAAWATRQDSDLYNGGAGSQGLEQLRSVL